MGKGYGEWGCTEGRDKADLLLGESQEAPAVHLIYSHVLLMLAVTTPSDDHRELSLVQL